MNLLGSLERIWDEASHEGNTARKRTNMEMWPCLASSCKSDSRKKSKYLDVYLHARPCMIWVCGAASGDENTDDRTPTHDYPSLGS